jgi:hypothetical protein
VPRVLRPIRPCPSTTRACGAVWHRRSPSVSLRGAGVRATVIRTEMPGFFALAAETLTLRVAWSRRCRSRGHELPAPIGWGSERGGRASDACCRFATRPVSLLDCRAWVVKPETHCLRTGLALANVSLHAPSTDSTLGSIMGQTGSPDTTTEGHTPAFRPLHTLSTLAAWTMIDDPVRVTHLLRRSTPYPRRALRLSSNTSPRCLEFRLYNRRCASRALVETSPLETVTERRGKTHQRSICQIVLGPFGVSAGPTTTPDHLAVIQPPTAARLTACCRLRAVRLSPSCLGMG